MRIRIVPTKTKRRNWKWKGDRQTEKNVWRLPTDRQTMEILSCTAGNSLIQVRLQHSREGDPSLAHQPDPSYPSARSTPSADLRPPFPCILMIHSGNIKSEISVVMTAEDKIHNLIISTSLTRKDILILRSSTSYHIRLLDYRNNPLDR